MICRVCSSANTKLFLERKSVSVHQNLVLDSLQEAKRINRGHMALYHCLDCHFVFNAKFDGDLLSYDAHYDNNQTYSSFFAEYVQSIVKYLIDDLGVKNKDVIELGCGKGYFLKDICAVGRNRGIGFDPSYVGPTEILDGTVRYEKKFYERGGHPNTSVDMVICRHVIEHISHPTEFLKTVKAALGQHSHARLFFETPSLEWILKNGVIWDFFYEHCSYFTRDSLVKAFELAGFHVAQVTEQFQGQYLWLVASVQNDSAQEIRSASNIEPMIGAYVKEEHDRLSKWTQLIQARRSDGKVAVWGAAAKGTTFVNLIDSKCSLIDSVIDINPNKQSKFIAGTGHPIVSYKDLVSRGVETVILMNPNYRKENEDLLRTSGIKMNIISEEVI